MQYLFELIEYAEANHHYAQVDALVKSALDMTDVLTEDNKQGAGVYGTFYSDFSREDKHQLKNKLGNIPENIGVKRYKTERWDDFAAIQNIKENLAFIYISPYILANTDLKTPVYNGSISLSGMIANKINITQKMPGVSLTSLINSLHLPKNALVSATVSVNGKIAEKLESIGVYCSDLHAGNYLIDNKVAEEFKSYIENNPNLFKESSWSDYSCDFDLSRNAALFDYGGFNVYDYTPPAQQLLKLKTSLEQRKKNKVINNVILAIRNMIYDS